MLADAVLDAVLVFGVVGFGALALGAGGYAFVCFVDLFLLFVSMCVAGWEAEEGEV